MKQSLTILVFSCLFWAILPCHAQNNNGTNFYGSPKDISGWEKSASYLQDADVERLIADMLAKNGTKNRYIIQSTNEVENCQATVKDGKPYILYNPQFLNRVKSLNFSMATLPKTSDQDWYALTILAHELGHHVNNHLTNRPPDFTQRDLELEADEFAGYMMYLMGATLNQAQRSYNDVPTEGGYTHPPRQQRLDALTRGYNKAKAQNKIQERVVEKTINLQDRDNDGLANTIDRCPDQAGTLKNEGCPEENSPATYTENVLGTALVFKRIPGGTFTMGSNEGNEDEKPTHSVTLDDYYLSIYETTLAQFRTFIDNSGYQTDAEKEGYSWKYTTEWVKMNGIDWRHDAEGKLQTNDQHPVIHVSWNDAMEYCKWLSRKTGKTYTLPTEAQWEYAAGNGSRHTKYAWGNGNPTKSKGGNVADETANETAKAKFGAGWVIFEGYTDNYATTAPVGQFGANDFGLYDMTGNVWEWCRDWYASDYYGKSPGRNPENTSTATYRVLRGGSWRNYPQYSRVANRNFNFPAFRGNIYGFRLVLAPQF